MPPPMSQCAHCVIAGGSKRCVSARPARYEVIAVEYRSRRCSSCTFFLSHTFHAFFSHSIAPLTYTSGRGGSSVFLTSAVFFASVHRTSSSYLARSYVSSIISLPHQSLLPVRAAAGLQARASSLAARTDGYATMSASTTHSSRDWRSEKASKVSGDLMTRAMVEASAQGSLVCFCGRS